MNHPTPTTLPELHRAFLQRAVKALQADTRIAVLAIGGSYLTNTMDEYSDLDFIVAIQPEAYAAVQEERMQIARTLGPLLAAFTGEHVGEPRLLICLYGPPLLHVDFKFVTTPELASRVEDPAVLWEREGALDASLQAGAAAYPAPDGDWIEERFWTWVHYGATKIARGELFEALDFLSFLRSTVLGPLCLQRSGARPSGVRRFETAAPEFAQALQRTVATYDAASCLEALRACVELYKSVRPTSPESAAETAVREYLREVRMQNDER